MKKNLKISYKVYHNTRLREVDFHSEQQYPIYIVVVYNRTPTYFKSYYFDLMTHPKYKIHSALGRLEPVTAGIVEKEEELLGYLSEKFAGNFNTDDFKKEYLRLGRDLLFEVEEDFQRYMSTFFEDEGLPVFASMITQGSKHTTSENILDDLKSVLKIELFSKLIENSTFYAPPYIPLCAFVRSRSKTAIPLFSVFDWNSERVRQVFYQFITKFYPAYNFNSVEQYLNELTTRHR